MTQTQTIQVAPELGAKAPVFLETVLDNLARLRPETVELIRSADALSALQLKITDDAGYQTAAAECGKVKTFLKQLDTQRKDLTRPLDDLKKEVMALFAMPAEKLEKVEKALKTGMLDYTNKKEADALAEANKLAARAERNTELGRVNMAAEQQAQAQAVVAQADVSAKGVAGRMYYTVEVTDMKALCRAVADGVVPAGVLQVNQGALDKMAQAMKGELIYPGCTVKSEKKLAVRAA